MRSASEVDRAQARASERRLADEPRRRYIDRVSSVLLAFYVLTSLNFFYYFREECGQLRLANGLANSLSILPVCALPAVILFFRFIAPYTRAKWWIIAGLAPLAALSGLFGFFCFFMGNGAPSLAKEIPVGNQTIRCFRNSEFLSSSIDIQEEQQVLPGIVWSVPIHHESGAVDIATKIIDKNHLQCKFDMDDDFTDGAYKKKTVMVSVH